MRLNHFQVSGLDFALSVLLFHLWMSSGVSRKNIPNPKTQSGVSGCFQYVMPILLLIASPVSVLTTSLFSAMRHGFAPQNGQGRISTCLSFIPAHPPCIYCRRTSRLARWKNLHLLVCRLVLRIPFAMVVASRVSVRALFRADSHKPSITLARFRAAVMVSSYFAALYTASGATARAALALLNISE